MEEVTSFDALWESANKCKSGVLWKDSVAHFMLNLPEEVLKLSNELEDGTYKERPRKSFIVTAPKKRDIVSIAFRDRVYQRALNDNAVYPSVTKSLIYDNCACQKGKGTDFARDRLKCHLQRFYRKNHLDGFILKLDVQHYYDSTPHSLAKEVFGKHITGEAYERAAKVLDSYPGEVGYNPGSQMVQIAGISVLDGIDHYIKERLHVKHYVRYMDDMILLCKNRKTLLEWKKSIEEEMAKIGFCLHDKKSVILPIRDGVMFLGFTFRLTETGKVLMLIDPKRVKTERKKLYRMSQLVKIGKMDMSKFEQCYQSWRNHASKGNTYRLLLRMDAYFTGLVMDCGTKQI